MVAVKGLSLGQTGPPSFGGVRPEDGKEKDAWLVDLAWKSSQNKSMEWEEQPTRQQGPYSRSELYTE